MTKNDLRNLLVFVEITATASLVSAVDMPHGGVQLWEGGPYWAECNLGANSPEESGCYFKWGDTTGYKPEGGVWTEDYPSRGYSDVTWVSSNGRRMSESPFATSKGRGNSVLDASGNLMEEYDAATVNLGKPWRIPTDAEFEELISNCRIAWTSMGGVSGLLVTGKGTYASNSIFLPAAGRGDGDWIHYYRPSTDGYYWASTTYPDSTTLACDMAIWSDGAFCGGRIRGYGQCIRPVRGGVKPDGGPYEESVDGVSWTFTVGGGKATVIGASPSTGSLVIPAKLGESPVISIGGAAFYECTGLTSVTIPEGVTSIGSSAFEYCSGLTSVTIPDSVKYIGESAFSRCSQLESVKIPEGLSEIGNWAFYYCSELNEVSIPSSVTSIGRYAFYACGGLTRVNISDLAKWCEISFWEEGANPLDYANHLFLNGEEVTDLVIPSCVTDIGEYTFRGCAGFTSITIPSGVTHIKDKTFQNCSGLRSVSIPVSMTAIGRMAFFGCDCLEKVEIADLRKWCEISFDGCDANPLYYAKHLYLNGNEIKDLEIPDGVTEIGEYTFRGCSGFESITIPMSMTHIGESVFEGCSGLVSVKIPSSVTSIGFNAFYDCNGLKRVEIADLLKWCEIEFAGYGANPLHYAKHLCLNGKEIKDLVIPESVTDIGVYTFRGCSGFESITIPMSITQLGDSVFEGCSGLMSVTIPESVTSVGNRAFSGCEGLSAVNIGKRVKTVGAYAFSGCCGLKTVCVPNCVTNIGESAFSGCSGLQEMTLPFVGSCRGVMGYPSTESLFGFIFGSAAYPETTEVRSYPGSGSLTFYIPSGLKSVIITDETEIGHGAFYNCSMLIEIAIPSTLTRINERAFVGCLGLESVHISDIAKWCGIVFVGDDANPFYCAKHLYLNGEEVVNLEIPEGVRCIGQCAFCGCDGLKSVTLPLGVENVGNRAFHNCRELTSIVFPSGVMNIGEYAFDGCDKLLSVTLPPSVTNIGYEAFCNCSRLESVLISDGMKTIGAGAFMGCECLTSVVVPTSVRSIGGSAFAGCWSITNMVLPFVGSERGNTGTMDSTFGWIFGTEPCEPDEGGRATKQYYTPASDYYFRTYYLPKALKSVVITDETQVGYCAFYNCSGLTTVDLPDSVTNIDSRAFVFCSGVRSIRMSKNIVNIGGYAFDGCETLMSIMLPDCVANIGQNAFSRCSALASIRIPRGVTVIANGTFYNCNGLKDVSVPKSVVNIDAGAFYGCKNLAIIYADNGDVERISGLYEWPDSVKIVEVKTPAIEGDEGATVTGDAETGFVIKPSVGNTAVEVTIPQGVDAAKVTVEVTPKVATVKPNGAKVKVVVGENDITDYLVIPESGGVLNIADATVREEVVKETLDPSKDAVIELNAANPRLTTAPTRKGLTYTLFEGHKLESLSKGDSKLGDGDSWTPTITVSGGNAAFYSIDVTK